MGNIFKLIGLGFQDILLLGMGFRNKLRWKNGIWISLPSGPSFTNEHKYHRCRLRVNTRLYHNPVRLPCLTWSSVVKSNAIIASTIQRGRDKISKGGKIFSEKLQNVYYVIIILDRGVRLFELGPLI